MMRRISFLGFIFIFLAPFFASAQTLAPYARYCLDPQTDFFKGSIYHTENGEPWIEVIVDPEFEANTLRGERKITGDIPLTPVYDLVVRVKPEFNYYCIPGWVEGAEVMVNDLPKTLPILGSLTVGTEGNADAILVTLDAFERTGAQDESGRFIFEWHIPGWPGGIAAGDKLERLIKGIAANEPIQVTLGIFRSDNTIQKETAAVSFFSNCAPIWGSGPHRILYSRLDTDYPAPTFMRDADSVRTEGFERTDPFRQPLYRTVFSHSIDLRLYDPAVWIDGITALMNPGFGGRRFTSRTNNRIFEDLAGAGSSCTGDSSTVNVALGAAPVPGFAALLGNGLFVDKNVEQVLKNMGAPSVAPLPMVVLHEYGHAFAGLNDEYISRSGPEAERALQLGPTKNCSIVPYTAWRYRGVRYGDVSHQGCTFETVFRGGRASDPDLVPVYRPSEKSMMNMAQTGESRFNVVSCGYIIAAITGGQAEEYWQECMGYDVVKPTETALSPFEQFFSLLEHHRGRLFGAVDASGQSPQGSLVRIGHIPPHLILESFDSSDPWGEIVEVAFDDADSELLSCKNPKHIIAVGGVDSPLTHPMFSSLEGIAPGATAISIKRRSIAQNTTAIKEAITAKLAAGEQVLVVAHSLGAVISYNLASEFEGKAVEFIYVDPPYDNTSVRFSRWAPSWLRGSTANAIIEATQNGIADDPKTVNWTDGKTNNDSHDPWTYPDASGNAKRLEELKELIKEKLCALALSSADGGESEDGAGIVSNLGLYSDKLHALQTSVAEAFEIQRKKRADAMKGKKGGEALSGNPAIDGPLYLLGKMTEYLSADANGHLSSVALNRFFVALKSLGEYPDSEFREVFARADDFTGMSYLFPPSSDKPNLIYVPGAGGDPMWRGGTDLLWSETERFNVIGYTYDPTLPATAMTDALLTEFLAGGFSQTEHALLMMSMGNTLVHSAILRSITSDAYGGVFQNSNVVSVGFLPGGSSKFLGKPKFVPSLAGAVFPPYAEIFNLMNPANQLQGDIANHIFDIQNASKSFRYIQAYNDDHVDLTNTDSAYARHRDVILETVSDHIRFVTPPETYQRGNTHINLLYAPEVKEELDNAARRSLPYVPTPSDILSARLQKVSAASVALAQENQGEGVLSLIESFAGAIPEDECELLAETLANSKMLGGYRETAAERAIETYLEMTALPCSYDELKRDAAIDIAAQFVDIGQKEKGFFSSVFSSVVSFTKDVVSGLFLKITGGKTPEAENPESHQNLFPTLVNIFPTTPVISGLFTADGTLYAGDMELSVEIRRTGANSAGTFKNSLQYAAASGQFTDWFVFDVPKFETGDIADISYKWRGGEGVWQFRLCADIGNSVAEGDETDNCSEPLSVEIIENDNIVPQVSVLTEGGADLKLATPLWTGLTDTGGRLYAGEMTLSAKVTNDGNGDSDPIKGVWQYSTDGYNFVDWVKVEFPPLYPDVESKSSYSWEGGKGFWSARFCVDDDLSNTGRSCSESVSVEIIE